MRDCISKVASRWGIVIPDSLSTFVGTPRIQVYAPGDMQFLEVLVLRDRAGLERQQRLVVTGRRDQCLRCDAFGHMAHTCPTQPTFP